MKPIQQCDKLFSLLCRAKHQKCIICGKAGRFHKESGLYISGLVTHHLLEKSAYLQFRFTKLNTVPVCYVACHTGPGSAPKFVYAHLPPKVDKETGEVTDNAFLRLLKLEHYENWKFYHDNLHNHRDRLRKYNYKCLAANLKAEFMELVASDLGVYPQG